MIPNMSALDSQPLFAAALQYVQNNGVQLVTADPGSYYFLTSQNDFIYVFLAGLSNLTVDLQGSTLFFKYGLLRGIELDNSQNVTLKNFTIDSVVPRFTQVQLTTIDPVQGRISYTVPPGWADPATFTTSAFGTPQLFALFFRNGFQVPATAITFITYPIASPALAITNNGEPWTQPDREHQHFDLEQLYRRLGPRRHLGRRSEWRSGEQQCHRSLERVPQSTGLDQQPPTRRTSHSH
jgi:hypothetical protein